MLTSRPAPLTASRPLHTKTPGRALQRARGILQENALQGPRTAKTHRVQLQTPSRGPSQKLFKEAQSSKAVVHSVVRPLGDKTPFANRQRRVIQDATPGPAKLNLPVQEETHFLTPGHALLPSSARKTVRGRHSSGPVFETPVPNGNHWDVIEHDITAPVSPEAQGEGGQLEDYDEIEYMAPTAIDPPYTPHFDVPDYELVGIQLFDMMHSFSKDDATDRFYAAEKEMIDDTGLLEASGFSSRPSQWNLLELLEDDDPSPFAGLGKASKLCAKVPPIAQRAGFAMKGAQVSRTRATTIPAPCSLKQPAAHIPLKRGQAVQMAPTPRAGPTKKLTPPTRPATVTGRVASASRTASTSTPRILTRPATSASLRPPKRTVKMPGTLQAGVAPQVADPEIILELDGVDVGNDDFMFDV